MGGSGEFLHIEQTVLTGLGLAVDNSTVSHEAGESPASQSTAKTGLGSGNRKPKLSKEQDKLEISVMSGQ